MRSTAPPFEGTRIQKQWNRSIFRMQRGVEDLAAVEHGEAGFVFRWAAADSEKGWISMQEITAVAGRIQPFVDDSFGETDIGMGGQGRAGGLVTENFLAV